MAAEINPQIRPKFNLGGQVSRYSSNPQFDVNEDGDNQIQTTMSASNKNRSLNPELLMREFTQDETGRIDSFGVTDSPSACFQSQFAREVVQNTHKSGSILDLWLPQIPVQRTEKPIDSHCTELNKNWVRKFVPSPR